MRDSLSRPTSVLVFTLPKGEKRTEPLIMLQLRKQLSVAALLAASVSAAAAGCAVHQECGSCLDATDDDNDSCFCAPHRSPRTHWL